MARKDINWISKISGPKLPVGVTDQPCSFVACILEDIGLLSCCLCSTCAVGEADVDMVFFVLFHAAGEASLMV